MSIYTDQGYENRKDYLNSLAEEYGIGILKIKEIIGMMPITTVPQTPDFVKGVINLRGKVIPVIDLRLRFGMTSIEYAERTCIIVVEEPAIDTGWKKVVASGYEHIRVANPVEACNDATVLNIYRKVP